LYVCFVDFKKAFDRVWQNALLYKLKRLGIGTLFFNLIKSMYSKINLAVKSSGTLSNLFGSNIGIRQGDPLSPIFFNIFINDLPDIFTENSYPPKLLKTSIPALMYADDLILLSCSKEGLQSSLNNLENYCNIWALDVNMNKTKVIVFNSTSKTIKGEVFFNGKNVEFVRQYTYLGVTFSSGGKFTDAKQSLTGKGLKAYFKLCKSLGRNTPHIKMSLHIFEHVVKPILLYGSEIWGCFDTSSRKLLRCDPCYRITKAFDNITQNTVCMKFYKFILGLPRSADNNAILGELGQYPLYNDIVCRMLKYWVRLESLPDDHLLKEAYLCNLQLQEKGTWGSSIRYILEELKLNEFWINKPKNNSVVNKAKKSLKENFENVWLKDLFNDNRKIIGHKRKLRTYRTFKINFELENYLSVIKNVEYRQNLLRFRISSHKLQIETGRYPYKPEHERTCKVCKTDVIENEYHFLLDCTAYDALKCDFETKIQSIFPGYINLPTNEQFIWLMASKHEKVIFLLSKYITQCLEYRKEILEN